MNLQQLHYTSTATTSADGSGFRFTAASPELPITLLGEAEHLIGYEPPADAPECPSSEELAAFPVAFSHNRLSDGSRLLCRTVRTGPGRVGRHGNFHAHAVRLPEGGGLPGGLLPIEAWESPSWSDRTPDGGVPEPLTAVVPARLIDKKGLLDFVRARAERLEPFLTDVRTLFRTPDAQQILVVERDSTAIAHWIAVASAVLPRDLADRLTFTTYTRHPMLARQQIVGIFPDARFEFVSAAAQHRYRVHDCTGGPSSPARAERDLWAAVAARIWLAGRPALFAEATRRTAAPAFGAGRGAAEEADRLAALAAREGIPLDSNGRTAAARWARTHKPGDSLDTTVRTRLLATVAAGGTERTPEEWTVLASLADELCAPGTRTAVAPLKRDLRTELQRAAETSDTPLVRFLTLLRLAEALRVDHSPVMPVLTARLTTALLNEASPDHKVVRAAIDAHPRLRTAVLDSLDHTAATDDPRPIARLLAAELPGADLAGRPHLSMAAAMAAALPPYAGPGGADDPEEDRPALLHVLMKTAGPDHQDAPSVLRTAFRLVWGDAPLTTTEADALLDGIPPGAHHAAGLEEPFMRAALTSGPHDPVAPALAGKLLRGALAGGAELDPRRRAALLLLEQAGALARGEAVPGCTARVVALRRQARPLEAGIDERLCDALARHLLSMDPPPAPTELPDLVHSEDEHLLAAYADEARGERVRELLHRTPTYAAVCFVAWHTAPDLSPVWDEIRTDLLSGVLRPEVRRMTTEEIEEIRRCLRQVGGQWAEIFHEWDRFGVLGRLGGRWRTTRGPRP
ncbi:MULTISPECIES: GTPase-associated protein 1-related protein [Streptomyces]|uniref:HEAT repeat domain-containing protein n=1 Tax=Streptomyces luteosporeus TaxID=173856 RepID=A0ABN3TU68_9ACTN